MKKKIIAAFMAMVLILTPAGSVLAEEAVQEDLIVEEISADEMVDLTDAEETEEVTKAAENELENNFVEEIAAETIAEDFIAAVEEVETKSYDTSAENEIVLDDVIMVDLDPAGTADSAAPAYISLYSNTVYEGSYGAQLSEASKVIYDAMVTAYVEEGAMDGPTVTLLEELYFSVDNVMTTEELKADENYIEAMYTLKCIIQPAFDAFVYDHPEVAWLGLISYTSSGATVSGQVGGPYQAVRIPAVKLITKEKYTGAKEDCENFSEVVDAVVEQLNCTEDMTKETQVKIIHDYLCGQIEYEETDYAHTAAGVFVKDGKVVCEGYAKAFKVLCDRLNIECVLVPGYANGAHMWNYVKMEDDNWYLMDVTWDDGEPVEYSYFLKGSSEVSRTVYPNFSDSVYTQEFVFPELTVSSYARTHQLVYVSNHDATCTSDGTSSVTCGYNCGTVFDSVTDKGSMLEHKLSYISNDDATCTSDGTKTPYCEYGCGTVFESVLDEGTQISHDWVYQSNHDATCTSDGSKTQVCSYGCGAMGSTAPEAGTKLPHSFITYVSNNDATVFCDGTKTASCVYGCGTTSTIVDTGTKLAPTWNLNASKITLKVGQSTTKVKVTGLAAGDSVKSWSSSNSKIVTVKNGKITAKKVGTAYVYVRLASDASGATPKIKIKVTVQKTAVKTTKIAGLSKTMTIAKGKKETLSPVLYPITSVEKITYASSNKKVAAVSSKGVITAKAAGKAKITVKAGTKKFTITVTVPKTKTTEIKNVPETLNLNLKKKKTYQLKAKCVPSNTDQKITYSSSKPSVVKVSTAGKLTAKKAGTAVITVKSGSIKVKCKVTVK